MLRISLLFTSCLSITAIPSIFPLPLTATSSPGCLLLSPSFKLTASGAGANDAYLTAALTRATAARTTTNSRSESYDVCDFTDAGLLSLITVFVNESRGSNVLPSLGDDESYTISIAADSIATSFVNATTVWGAMRGLESLSQLISGAVGDTKQRLFISASSVSIADAPRFSHRGLMIDTGRAFIPVNLIMATLDAMSYVKLNVLHWHITDDQAFPIVSAAWPNLTMGAMQAPALSHTYARSDAVAIIEAAAERGIRVIPEFDVPGHSTSWFAGYPQLATVCECPDCGSTFSKPMDPTLETTYDFLSTLFTEMTSVFPDAFFHIGGDEVDPTCWLNNSNVVAFMKVHGFETTAQLQEYFESRVFAMLPKKEVIIWEGNFGASSTYPSGAIVEAWKEKSGNLTVVEKLIRANYTVIYTTPSWYLDWIEKGDDHVDQPGDWVDYHTVDPLANTTLTPVQQQKMLGAEVAMWTLYEDASNFMPTVFPRATAVAERLWSAAGATVDDSTALLNRMRNIRCRMIARGIAVSPIEIAGSCPNSGQVNYVPPWGREGGREEL